MKESNDVIVHKREMKQNTQTHVKTLQFINYL